MTLGIDIGGTRVKAGIVNADGKLMRSATADTPSSLGEFRAVLLQLITQMSADSDIQSVGIGCKGILHPSNTTVEVLPGTLHYLEGQTLSRLLDGAIPAGIPVRADNDARVALAGEIVWGAARGRSDVLMLTLGTGVGGAVLAGGRVLRGSTGIAGHIGHLTIDPLGPLCICGNRGCLETFFSARAIEFAARNGIERGCSSSLRPGTTCAEVFEAAAGGDRLARLVIDESIRTLGAAVAGLIHLLDPEIIIVGGQISEAGAALFDPLAEEVHSRTRCLLRRDVPLVPPQVADRSGIVGAAALALS